MIIPSKKVDDGHVFSHNVCIIGAGVAGITLARETEKQFKDVCLVESGDIKPDNDTQRLYDLESVGSSFRKDFQNRIRYLGGSCNIWPGRTMVLNELDFAKRDWVPNSGWPINYSELVRYYEGASKILGVPTFDYYSTDAWKDMMSSDERTFLSNDLLRLNVSLWGKRAARFGYRTRYYKHIKRSSNITVYLNANVTELFLCERGDAVESVQVCCLDGKRYKIKAKYFVLACGGLENARILLDSRSQQLNGVGNAHDVVGRYFSDHPRCIKGQIKLRRNVALRTFLGAPFRSGRLQVGIALSNKTQEDEGLLNNYVSLEPKVSEWTSEAYQAAIGLAKRFMRKGYSGKRLDYKTGKIAHIPEMIYLLTPKELLPHWMYYWNARINKFARSTFDVDHLIIANYCEQAPNRESRVYLSKNLDQLGMRRLVIDWKIGDQEKHTLLRLQEILDTHLVDRGFGKIVERLDDIDDIDYTDASHHIGTTRMSDNPKEGVVNRNCRLHSVKNLFVIGSSVFPTGGHANPTLSIVALTLRLSSYMRTFIK